ncbi:hypothetical protein HY338_04095 [Candidatus Gottesmanbacteria bacterium]|nr:hypothetical protein [Candidatus Gottesmanbacteria bacterium]
METIKNGATDYVLKNHLFRLVPAIYRAIREAEDRKEKKRLEEQFNQIQKLEALGRLAGGIAHDFNNQLTVITGFAEMALELVDEKNPIYKSLLEIKKAGERSSNLTRQLLAFTRKQVEEKKLIDLNELILNLDKVDWRILKAIKLVVDASKNTLSINKISLDEASGIYHLILVEGEEVEFSQEQDPYLIAASLQIIISRFRIEGKIISQIKFQFDKPVVVLKSGEKINSI